LPKANPSYEAKFESIDRWLVVFPDGEEPNREIGLDANGAPILSGPSEVDCGFWLDTNVTFGDFEGDVISEQEFEEAWSLSQQLTI